MGYPPGNEQVLLTIGDMALTQTHVIVPHGRYPLNGTVWAVQDSTQVHEGIPPVAIVLTIIFVWFCLLGLLFLLMKQRRYTGFVTISVTGQGLYHTVQLPPGPESGAWAAQVVSQARSLAASAPPAIA
ncbi:hypothetical protein [Actinomadura keratinilytica]|uniref:ResB-like domain-containing protein n=2 Tax=Actinomadura keratinilytica TaxID=547461 RepID=A0ABP7Z9P4_9ACTN